MHKFVKIFFARFCFSLVIFFCLLDFSALPFFTHEVFSLLLRKHLTNSDLVKKILSWQHTGFNVHSKVRTESKEEAERVGKYMIRPILSLKNLYFTISNPHACGENNLTHRQLWHKYGPSPHAWGKYNFGMFNGLKRRSIPTRVGKISFLCLYYHLMTVHPHTRGENIISHQINIQNSGPSPHAWGK